MALTQARHAAASPASPPPLTEHARIVEAMQRRNPDAAEEAARQHVRAAQRERLKRLFPDAPS